MKKFKLIFAILTLLIASVMMLEAQVKTSFAQPNVSSRAVVSFHFVSDSLDADTSSAFGLAGFDAESFYSYPLAYGKIITSAGTPKISAYIDGSYDPGSGQWIVVDTILTTDSLKTFAIGALDLNNKHCPKYRLRVVGTAGNRRDTQGDIFFYAYKKSY